MAKQIIGWKLYYGDGGVVSSLDSSWAGAPSENVQVLIVYFADTYNIWHDDHWDVENYRDMLCGGDYYWELGNGQAAVVPENASVKLGRELPEQEWRDIYNRAMQDATWLPIS